MLKRGSVRDKSERSTRASAVLSTEPGWTAAFRGVNPLAFADLRAFRARPSDGRGMPVTTDGQLPDRQGLIVGWQPDAAQRPEAGR